MQRLRVAFVSKSAEGRNNRSALHRSPSNQQPPASKQHREVRGADVSVEFDVAAREVAGVKRAVALAITRRAIGDGHLFQLSTNED